jgi:mannose-1-phosphate guanylyltransferase/mannose-6-phosphate isomerase
MGGVMIIPVILAGGSGTRLWPLSRRLYPKQFINFIEQDSLFQKSLARLGGNNFFGKPLVVCNDEHRFVILEQINQCAIDVAKVLLEPVRRNTAPAIVSAALYAHDQYDDPILLALPSDHFIEDVDLFVEAIKLGADIAENGKIITFGITPTDAAVEYGYIKKGDMFKEKDLLNNVQMPQAWQASGFKEKPDINTAKGYLKTKSYLWNSGIFLFKASTMIDAAEKHESEVVGICRQAVEKGHDENELLLLEKEAFNQVKNISIDYAVMEKSRNIIVVEFQSGWSDLGSWFSLWQVLPKSEDNNVVSGDVVQQNTSNSYLYSSDRLVAALNIDNLAVIETKDVVFVSDLKSASEVKNIVGALNLENRPEVSLPSRVYRPWGDYEEIDQSKRYKVKRLTVKPGSTLSLQQHYHRSEHWIVVSGTALVTRGDEKILLKEDQSTYIPQGEIHRIENPGKINLEIIEVQSGDYLEEDDIVRFDDVYGRENSYGENPGER